ncbi:glycosyltransferase family 2 protein [Novosphingobium beihaiensis]|uniref:Glycosyltransferase family 2 protein n=1 Tax=Novosphingobium beihaiensis TaxID=2930389 RepID=A0ABT0BU21_9SPHN|nr:glycosyltransferase family A protein [Novosphingobium beihaiensis]MCJ2188388.1 glycosyltransferase family 2 protein [Novosphingobium beihaiensis]
MRLHVVFATLNRAELLTKTVDRLADQIRQPDGIVISATCPADVLGLETARPDTHVLLSGKGLCKQRNRALDYLAGNTDIVVFFDDDFVPHKDYLAEIERLFVLEPDVAGATGDLLDDGIHGDEIAFEDAVERLDSHGLAQDDSWRSRQALYGCNMAIRMSCAEGLQFDEALPLYGWQEDIDYTYQLGQRGRMVSGPRLTGIHLGTRSARTPGKRLGYSQVANLVHMWRKGTMQPRLGQRLMLQNLTSNAARSLFPEPHIDRRGRLTGNLMAIGDLMRGRIDPRRVETL